MTTDMYSERISRVREQMHLHGLDFLAVGPSADLRYLTGANHRPSERLALLVVSQEGPAYMVLPGFEAASLPDLPPEVRVVTWGESERPARVVAGLITSMLRAQPGGADCTIGVSDRLWSVFLLQLQSELPRAAFTLGSPVLSAVRQLKNEHEIELLRRSGAAADEAFREICTRPLEGSTELEIGKVIASLLEERGLVVEGSPIVASGPNSASPHHHAGSRRIEHGDVVVLDFGGTFEGYYSDITRTVFVGAGPSRDSEEEKVYNLVAEAQEAAVKAARPGMTCEALDRVARDILAAQGYGEFFTHRLGHGIGLDGHEPPYLVQGNASVLQPGMAFSVEPGLYLPGRFGVRVEDTVVLHESGAERMNNAPHQITIVN
jgi:Xaa-Pro aminopeptidase